MTGAPETPPGSGWAVIAADGAPISRRGDLTAAEAAALAASAATHASAPDQRRRFAMTAHLAAWGRLVADPEQRTTRAGKPWATARLAVAVPAPSGADESDEAQTLWLSIAAFGKPGESLARHIKGECVSVSGRLQMKPYTARNGARREGWSIVVDSVIGPRTPRARGGGRRKPDNRTSGPDVAPSSMPRDPRWTARQVLLMTPPEARPIPQGARVLDAPAAAMVTP